MPTVLAEVVPGLVLELALIHPIGVDQPQERLARQPELANRRLQRLQDRPFRLALVAGCDLPLELVERGEPVFVELIAEDVDEAGETVDRTEMGPQPAGEEDRGNRKVLGSGAAGHGGDVHH